jgi:hypothetical protein
MGRSTSAKASATSRSPSAPDGTDTARTLAVVPSTNSRLKMFEPTTLPTAMACETRSTPIREVTSSGRLVPTATTVRPIRVWEIPRAAARDEADPTVTMPPSTSAARPSAQ